MICTHCGVTPDQAAHADDCPTVRWTVGGITFVRCTIDTPDGPRPFLPSDLQVTLP